MRKQKYPTQYPAALVYGVVVEIGPAFFNRVVKNGKFTETYDILYDFIQTTNTFYNKSETNGCVIHNEYTFSFVPVDKVTPLTKAAKEILAFARK